MGFFSSFDVSNEIGENFSIFLKGFLKSKPFIKLQCNGYASHLEFSFLYFGPNFLPKNALFMEIDPFLSQSVPLPL